MAVVRNRRALITGVQPFDADEQGRSISSRSNTPTALELRPTRYSGRSSQD